MPKSFGETIIQGMREAAEIEQGRRQAPRRSRHRVTARTAEVAPPPKFRPTDIQRIRGDVGMSQPIFAKALGKSPGTIRAWEQGQREPDGAARRLLEFAERYPRAFSRTVRPKRRRERGAA